MPSASQQISRPAVAAVGHSSDSSEVRLAHAEKQISIALQSSDYDQLITAASDALAVNSKPPGKTETKARKNLLWARSHAYQHKGLHELALKDARAALRIDPSDPASYLRTAVMLASAGHNPQALSCLDKAESLVTRYEPSSKASWLRRVDKQRKKLSPSSDHPIKRLPTELLIDIASHLPTRDCYALSHTCRQWRQTLTFAPTLWKNLTMVIDADRFPEAKALRWLQHIQMQSDRAQNALESAEFLGLFPERLLLAVLNILRASSKSLRYISIPSQDHVDCYDLLYRFCPNLNALAMRGMSNCSVDIGNLSPSSPLLRDHDFSHLLELPSSEPFSLESLHAEVEHPSLSQHLQGVRSLRGYHPSSYELRYKQRPDTSLLRPNPQQEEETILRSLANSLEDWSLDHAWPAVCRAFPIQQQAVRPPITISFPKLIKLENFSLDANFKFHFPRLHELNAFVLPYDGPQRNGGRADFSMQAEFARLLNTSPKLRKLQMDASSIREIRAELVQALCGLGDLEDLAVSGCSNTDLIREILTPKLTDNATEVELSLPKLRRLALDAYQLSIPSLASLLLVRERLRQGHGLLESQLFARGMTVGLSNTRAPSASPFQRGAISQPRSTAREKAVGPFLKNTDMVQPLEHLNLYNIRGPFQEVKPVLERLVPDFICKHDRGW